MYDSKELPHDKLNLPDYAEEKGAVTMQLVSIKGEITQSMAVWVTQGENLLTSTVRNLDHGNYVLEVRQQVFQP